MLVEVFSMKFGHGGIASADSRATTGGFLAALFTLLSIFCVQFLSIKCERVEASDWDGWFNETNGFPEDAASVLGVDTVLLDSGIRVLCNPPRKAGPSVMPPTDGSVNEERCSNGCMAGVS
jgi:hypothetical protein